MGRPSSLTIGSTPIWGRFGNFSWMRLQLDDTIQLLRCEVQESCTYNLAAQCILISLQPSDVAGNLEENRYVCFVFMLLPVLFQKKYEICSFFFETKRKTTGAWTIRGQTVERPIRFVERPIRFVERPIKNVDTPPQKAVTKQTNSIWDLFSTVCFNLQYSIIPSISSPLSGSSLGAWALARPSLGQGDSKKQDVYVAYHIIYYIYYIIKIHMI